MCVKLGSETYYCELSVPFVIDIENFFTGRLMLSRTGRISLEDEQGKKHWLVKTKQMYAM